MLEEARDFARHWPVTMLLCLDPISMAPDHAFRFYCCMQDETCVISSLVRNTYV